MGKTKVKRVIIAGPDRKGHDPKNPSYYCYTRGCRNMACMAARNDYLRRWRRGRRTDGRRSTAAHT